MTIVDYVYRVGQWSSPTAPLLSGLFDLALCERLLLEPLACGEGGPGGGLCVRVFVCVCVL